MARILFVWELGGGRGHLLPMRDLAAPLVADGHRVTFALRELRLAETVLNGTGIDWLQAPHPRNPRPRPLQTTACFADVLRGAGFGDAATLGGTVRAWRSLFDTVRPDLVLFDHSPAALVAARGRPFRRVLANNGSFFIPAARRPLPALVEAKGLDDAELTAREDRTLAVINEVLGGDEAPLTALHELYKADLAALLTLPELDHLPGRPDSDYWGLLPAASGGAPPEWPAGDGRRVFAYLKPFPALGALLEVLAKEGPAVIAFVDGAGSALARRFAGTRVRIADRAIDLNAALAGAALAICPGGQTAVTAALAGVPLLIVPGTLEQTLTGAAVARAGLGLSAPKRAAAGLRAKVKALLTEPRFAGAAAAFAARHAGRDPGEPARRLQAGIRTLLSC